eukprot:scaffold18206_cov39-Tisochrysis_lutea.AAC.3
MHHATSRGVCAHAYIIVVVVVGRLTSSDNVQSLRRVPLLLRPLRCRLVCGGRYNKCNWKKGNALSQVVHLLTIEPRLFSDCTHHNATGRIFLCMAPCPHRHRSPRGIDIAFPLPLRVNLWFAHSIG